MTTEHTTADELSTLVKAYFTRVDSGDPELLDMFSDDAQVFYPKFGIAHGRDEITQFVVGLTSAVARFSHEESRMEFTQSGNRVVVEGVEEGVLANGAPFPGSARSGGRYCNVFEFEGALISRLHIYADPDLAGVHDDLFPWGSS